MLFVFFSYASSSTPHPRQRVGRSVIVSDWERSLELASLFLLRFCLIFLFCNEPVVVRKVPSEARWGPNDFCVFCSFAFLFDFSFLFCNEPVVVRKVPSESRWGPNEKLEAKHNCLIRLTKPPCHLLNCAHSFHL